MAANQSERSKSADIVLTGGNIYTLDAARTWAQAVAIQDGKICYVGTDQGVRRLIGQGTRLQELNGRMVLPGFHDCHVHLAEGGLGALECDVSECKTKEDLLAKVKEYADSHKNDPWIVGAGWSLPMFPHAAPNKAELDAVVPDKPALLFAEDGHSSWVNTAALAAAKITKNTPDPPHGRIEHEPDSGEPSGTLREDASELVRKVSPKHTDTQRLTGLTRAIAHANSFGITSVQEADTDADTLNAYLELQRRGNLNLKVVAALHTDPDLGAKQVARLMHMRDKFSQGRVRATSVKIFADGVIESHTASLIKPYSDLPSERGMPEYTAEKLARFVSSLSLARFQVHIHAIGDQAVHDALDAFEFAHSLDADLRHEIAHLELIDPSDIERFRKLGVIANCQMFWAFNDPYILQATVPVLGEERCKQLYLFGSLYRSGATLAGGSDWTVSTLNPLDAIQVAVTRESLEGDSKPLLPDQRLALPDAIAAYTINGAFTNHQEHETGSLEVGKAADLTVLDKNLFALSPTDIHKTKVVLTMLDGKEVFRDDTFPQQDVATNHSSADQLRMSSQSIMH